MIDAPLGAGPPASAPPLRARLVGVFTIVGLLLIAAALAVLGSSRLFAKTATYVAFFPNPVGLKDGAPVTFRQAPVGQVRDVELVFTGRGVESEIMVTFDVRRSTLRNLSGAGSGYEKLSDRELADLLVKEGLRASVRSSSPLGGQKSLDLDFHPEIPARLTGLKVPYPEVATGSLSRIDVIQAKVEAALEKVSDLPIGDIVLQAKATLESAQKLLDNGDLEAALSELRQVLETTDRTVARLERTMDGVDGLVVDVRGTITGANHTMKNVDATLARLEKTLGTVDRVVDRTAETQYGVVRSLDELGELLRSLRMMVDTLQRHPEALLQGKPAPKQQEKEKQ
jgi:paraquat-inducible protein B